jgi:predicted DNA binding CopG/RHH family protein
LAKGPSLSPLPAGERDRVRGDTNGYNEIQCIRISSEQMIKTPSMTKGEKNLLDSYEKGEWKSVRNLKTEINRYQKIAKATIRKDKRINIRIAAKDLEDIQKKVLEEGIPYQMLISNILHKYASGRFA